MGTSCKLGVGATNLGVSLAASGKANLLRARCETASHFCVRAEETWMARNDDRAAEQGKAPSNESR